MVLLLVWSEASGVWKHLQQGRSPGNDRFQRDGILPRLWLRNDAEFKLPCRWSRGRRPTARRPMSRSTRVRARTETRATAKRLPTSSRSWTPSSDSVSLRLGRGRGLLTGGKEAGARRAQDTVAELQAPSSASTPGHGSQGEGQQGSQGCQAGRGGHRGASALKRAEVDEFKATLLQHNNNVELLELRYRTEAGSAELCHFESPGVLSVAAPLSPIQWAAGFRNCLNAEARDVFDAFCRELEQSPDSEGLGPTAETCHSARACSRDAAGSWSFRAVPEAQGRPSARRAALAMQLPEVGVEILGLQEADRGKVTFFSVRATPCGFQPQRGAALAGRSSGSTPASATKHGRSFPSATRPDVVTCRVGGHTRHSRLLCFTCTVGTPSSTGRGMVDSTG